MNGNNYYTINATETSAGELAKGNYVSLMKLRDALNHGRLSNIPNSQKYGFFSPVDERGRVLVGEATMIAGVVYWTEYNSSGNKIRILPLDSLISFGQVMVVRPDYDDKSASQYSNQTVPYKDTGIFFGFKNEPVYIRRENNEASNSVKWVEQVSSKRRENPSIVELISDSISNTTTGTGSPFSASNSGMVMACFKAVLGPNSQVRTSFEPAEPIKDNEKTTYPPITSIQQHIEDIKADSSFYILFTNFMDRISNEIDVKAPHLHCVPKDVVELVQNLQSQGVDIENPEQRQEVDRQIAEIIINEKLQVGGHITKLGIGIIEDSIYFQPEHACVMFSNDNSGIKKVPLNDFREKILENIVSKSPITGR